MRIKKSRPPWVATVGAAMAAGLALLGCLAAPASAVPSTTAAEHLLASSKAVKVMAAKDSVQGLRLVSEHRNGDGSITSRWTSNNGTGFTYAGTADVTVHLRSGKASHGRYGSMTVTLPKASNQSTGHSTYTDALNAGIPRAEVDAKLSKYRPDGGAHASVVDPGGPPHPSIGGCIQPVNPPDVRAVWGCFTRTYLGDISEGWAADDVMATENPPAFFFPSTLYALMWYEQGTSVPHYTPAPGGTGCKEASWNGQLGVSNTSIGYSETANICSGYTEVIHDSAHFGLSWIDNVSHLRRPAQETIEEIGTVYAPPWTNLNNSAFELAWGPGARDAWACTVTICPR
ncbi:hypothetical protein ACFOY4_09815 [Actinomadura syzygii]|uniref:Uncharacterized protein n=1 Tax=Actinomadura syzygii TaxID=1427538 RepID=A0A5D0UE40_9ACTN|nr:hypothetical protein [Actinomadura syzygii]TYC15885.1 hypothetical protein FXF65_11125 [Actinomadura syzygii]